MAAVAAQRVTIPRGWSGSKRSIDPQSSPCSIGVACSVIDGPRSWSGCAEPAAARDSRGFLPSAQARSPCVPPLVDFSPVAAANEGPERQRDAQNRFTAAGRVQTTLAPLASSGDGYHGVSGALKTGEGVRESGRSLLPPVSVGRRYCGEVAGCAVRKPLRPP